MPQQGRGSASKKSKARRHVEEYCFYTIEILGCSTRYEISENRGRRSDPGPYSELVMVKLSGKVLEPEKISNRTICCTLYGHREHDMKLNYPHDYLDDTRSLIGHLTARKDYCGFTGWLPSSMLLSISLLIAARELRYLDLLGKPLFRNEAPIHNISIFKELESD